MRGDKRLPRPLIEIRASCTRSLDQGILSSIISRTAGTHYVNEAVVKAASRLFFHARIHRRQTSQGLRVIYHHLHVQLHDPERFCSGCASTKYPEP